MASTEKSALLTRRHLLRGLIAAPAVVAIGSLMPLRGIVQGRPWWWDKLPFVKDEPLGGFLVPPEYVDTLYLQMRRFQLHEISRVVRVTMRIDLGAGLTRRAQLLASSSHAPGSC
jgi:hypothetical protein